MPEERERGEKKKGGKSESFWKKKKKKKKKTDFKGRKFSQRFFHLKVKMTGGFFCLSVYLPHFHKKETFFER